MIHEQIEQTAVLAKYLEAFEKIYREHNGFVDEYTQRSEEEISDETLLRGILNCGDLRAHDKANGLAIGSYVLLREYDELSRFDPFFIKLVADRFPGCSVKRSGWFFYPPNTGMGWHTNADQPYTRCYLNWSETGDSYFRYRDPKTDEIITSLDYRGWNIRIFEIGDEPETMLWHCVYSNTRRISIGLKVVKNLM